MAAILVVLSQKYVCRYTMCSPKETHATSTQSSLDKASCLASLNFLVGPGRAAFSHGQEGEEKQRRLWKSNTRLQKLPKASSMGRLAAPNADPSISFTSIIGYEVLTWTT